VLAELEAGAELTGGAWARAAVERCRGLLGPEDEVEARLAAALAAHADPAMPFEAARTRLALGERLRRTRRPAAARAQLAAARDAFAAMGGRSWAARAERELAAAGGDAVARGSDALTARERDVCDLVAAGATNREVAAALFLSPRTVEHHLRIAYRKLGVRSRSELAARRPDA
jgi:DNA-binding CsgD family transcriptional regulator